MPVHRLLTAFCCALWPLLLPAQLCTGNLGDPIVNIDFGAGYNPGLPFGSTSYDYMRGCPTPGKYTIADLLFGCESNTWFLLAGDHSRTAFNSNYMLLNASASPGTVILQSASGLCSNTTYEFAAWVMNVMQATACGGNPALPNLSLIVEALDGSILARYDTGDLPITAFKTWTQYGVFFTTPPGTTTVLLRITSNSSHGCGSAFALDDVTLKACGPQVAVLLDGADTTTDVCAGYTNPFLLSATWSTAFTDPQVQWQNSSDTGTTWQDITGATTAAYNIPQRDSGVVLYRMVIADKINFGSPQCRITSNVIWTNVHPLPLHRPTTPIIGCLGKPLTLPASPGYVLNYYWLGPGGFSSTEPTPTLPNVQYSDSGIYSVRLTADFGCSVTDSFYLQAYPSTTVSAATEYAVCSGSVVQLSASGDGSYVWTPELYLSDPHSAQPVASPPENTQYKVTLTNSYGCKDSAFVNVQVNQRLAVTTGRDKQILLGDSIQLDATVSGTAVEYYWTPPAFINDTHIPSPLVFPPASTDYTLHAGSTVGCGNETRTVKVSVINGFNIPNAFTPNGDGLNDVFRITPLDNYIVDRFSIYNRWGAVIFNATDPYKGWDGTINHQPQSIGAYIYYVQMHSAAGKTITRKGTFMLLR